MSETCSEPQRESHTKVVDFEVLKCLNKSLKPFQRRNTKYYRNVK